MRACRRRLGVNAENERLGTTDVTTLDKAGTAGLVCVEKKLSDDVINE